MTIPYSLTPRQIIKLTVSRTVLLFLPQDSPSRSPPRWIAMTPSDKHFRCTVCQRGFTRIDHLKRHHLRRTLAPCTFFSQRAHCRQIPARNRTRASFATRPLRGGGCKDGPCARLEGSFFKLTTYSDNLRDHYTDCAQRGDRKIPETGQRGRRRHACQSVGFPLLRANVNSTSSESLVELTFLFLTSSVPQ